MLVKLCVCLFRLVRFLWQEDQMNIVKKYWNVANLLLYYSSSFQNQLAFIAVYIGILNPKARIVGELTL